MNGHRYLLHLFLSLICFGLGSHASSAGAVDIRVAFISTDPYSPINRAIFSGARRAAALHGLKANMAIKVTDETPRGPDEGDFEEHLATLQRGGLHLLVEAPVTPDRSRAFPTLANAVTFGSSAAAAVDVHINERELGRQAGLQAAVLARSSDRVILVAGPEDDARSQERLSGFQEAFPTDAGVTIQETIHTGYDARSALQAIQAVVGDDPLDRIDGWVMLHAGGLQTAPSEAAWRTSKKVFCVAIDAPPAALAHLKAGNVDILIAPDYSEVGLRAMEFLLRGDTGQRLIHRDDRPIPIDIIKASNREAFEQRWLRWLR